MNVTTFRTKNGPVPVWGGLSAFSTDRWLLFVIRGAFADFDQLFGLAEALPDIDVALVHLPGMHTPFFKKLSVAAFAASFDEVLTKLGHRRIVVLGLSIGGTVALGMRHSQIASLLLVDTPLTTPGLWPLLPVFDSYAGKNADGDRWMDALFGYRAGQMFGRDYRHLLSALTIPTGVLFGDDPLGSPRSLPRLPSLVSEDERGLYRSHPHVSARIVEGVGHNIPRDGQWAIMRTLRRITATNP